jgi:hypothetical protein
MIELIVDFSKEADKKRFFKVLQNLKAVRYVISLKQFRRSRSTPQLRYYWGVVVDIIARDNGNTPDEIHEVLKRKFNPQVKVFKATGESWVMGGSTSDFDTAEMEEYLEKIRIWALTELEILIPLPNEVISSN